LLFLEFINLKILLIMARNHIAPGNTVTVVLTSGQTGYASGEGYKVGSQLGVIMSLTRNGQTVMNNAASAAGDQAVVALCGVWELPKASGAFTVGQRLYWDNTELELTGTATGNTFAGFAFAAAASDDTTAQVNLMGGDAAGDSGFAQAANVAALTGTLTGTVDGALADVAAVSTAGGNTYSDAAINTAITAVNLQLKELQTKQAAILTSLKNAGLMASS